MRRWVFAFCEAYATPEQGARVGGPEAIACQRATIDLAMQRGQLHGGELTLAQLSDAAGNHVGTLRRTIERCIGDRRVVGVVDGHGSQAAVSSRMNGSATPFREKPCLAASWFGTRRT